MTVRQDLIIRQGETWSFTWTKRNAAGVVVDLTGYTARAALKRSIGGPRDAYLSTGADAYGGSIALGGVLGTVTLSMTAAQSAALGGMTSVEDRLWADIGCDPAATIDFIYDLELVNPSAVVVRELEGRASVSREVTR